MITFTEEDHQMMLSLAKKSIEHGFTHGSPCAVDPKTIPTHLHINLRTFVGISRYGNNVGCMGNFDYRPIFVAIRNNSFNSAFRDTRFCSLSRYKLNQSTLKIHYLVKGYHYDNIKKQELLEILDPCHSIILSYNGKKTAMVSAMQEKWGKYKFVDETICKMNIGYDVPFELFQVELVDTVSSPEIKYSEIGLI
jgi:AMMECR1 domain-containing protein